MIKYCRCCLHTECPDRLSCYEIMKACMQTNKYGMNTGSGFTGTPISKCKLCSARMTCDKITWVLLGGME